MEFKGQDEEQAEGAGVFLMKAFGIALFLMCDHPDHPVQQLLFERVVILFAVVMSTIGVLIGLLIIDQPFGIVMSGIGVIALAGIVVNHNIILVGTSDRLRAARIRSREAILRTCAQRLRPVLLTTITAILGLLPMVFRVNIDFITRESHRRRALDPVVDAAFHRHRLRSRFRHGADADPDAMRPLMMPGQHRAVAGNPAAEAGRQATAAMAPSPTPRRHAANSSRRRPRNSHLSRASAGVRLSRRDRQW